MKSLFLHIGHGKTGTSHIQTCFALSQERLKEFDILYPDGVGRSASAIERQKMGWPTLGNFAPVQKSPCYKEGDLQNLLDTIDNSFENHSLLLSSEGLFMAIESQEFLKTISKVMPEHEVNVLLATRDPLEHVSSVYMQHVRSGKASFSPESFSDYLQSYNMPLRVLRILRLLSASNTKHKVINYSRQKYRLMQEVCSWLNISKNTMLTPDKDRGVINRSLTYSEALFLSKVNHNSQYRFKKQLRGISDRLANALPNYQPCKAEAHTHEIKSFLDKWNPRLSEVNQLIDQDNQYDMTESENLDSRGLQYSTDSVKDKTLTFEQSDIIASEFAKMLLSADAI